MAWSARCWPPRASRSRWISRSSSSNKPRHPRNPMRPFKVLGIQQIAIGGTDKLKLQKLWVDLFGLEITGTFRSERENVDEDICALGSGPLKVEVDLMQP